MEIRKSFLQEAFKALDVLNEEDFDLNNSNGIEELEKFVDNDSESDDLLVIDGEAESEEELQDSYIGKVILDCQICHSKIYESPENIVVDEETSLVNIDQECPFCFSNDGYKIIGMVSPFNETDTDEIDDTVEVEDEDVDEGLLGTIGGIFGGPIGAIGGSIADDVINKVNSSKNESLEESVLPDIATAVYNALSDIAFKYDQQGYDLDKFEFDDALNLFLDRFFDSESTNEAMNEGADKWLGKSIASALQSPEYQARLDKLLNTSNSLKDLKDNFCKLVNSTKVSDDVKKKACARINNVKNIPAMYSTITTYVTGDKIINPAKVGANESLEKVEIEPEEDKIEFTTKKGEKVVVTSECDDCDEREEEEILAPVDTETKEIIDDANDEAIDVDFEDFDEETFDELGESYLKKVYNNVSSFNTQLVEVNGNNLIVEGLITFDSGNKKKTRFVFESHNIDRRGNLNFIGQNKHLSNNRKSFLLSSYLKHGKLVNESLKYNYRARDKEGNLVRLYGAVKCNENKQSNKKNKVLKETFDVFHNDNGIDYDIIERSVSGKNALLNRGKQWIVAWNCPKNNEGSWGQGHYFSDEATARRFWEDEYVNEACDSKKHKRRRKTESVRSRRSRRSRRK